MKSYTVVGLWEGNEQSFIEHVYAESPTNAEWVAKVGFSRIWGPSVDDLRVLAVFKGHLRDLYDETDELIDEEVI